ncbi:hypothetical protein IGI43_002907 [Enterococcus sp. AZ126]
MLSLFSSFTSNLDVNNQNELKYYDVLFQMHDGTSSLK